MIDGDDTASAEMVNKRWMWWWATRAGPPYYPSGGPLRLGGAQLAPGRHTVFRATDNHALDKIYFNGMQLIP